LACGTFGDETDAKVRGHQLANVGTVDLFASLIDTSSVNRKVGSDNQDRDRRRADALACGASSQATATARGGLPANRLLAPLPLVMLVVLAFNDRC
jgi:hypothetical protein